MASPELHSSPDSGSPDAPHRRTLLSRALPLIAPAVLVVIALLQMGRAHMLDQSSWAGVGFGMFATFENEQTRTVRIEVIEADGDVIFLDPRGAPLLELAAREVPTDANLEALARWAFELNPQATAISVTVDGIGVAINDDGEHRTVAVSDEQIASIEWTP